jgi:hypothetical protein
MIKLRDVLAELLDSTTGKKYDLQGPKILSYNNIFDDNTETYYNETSYVWIYKNHKHQKMDIKVILETDKRGKKPRIIISFGMAAKRVDNKYGAMTGAGDLKIILKTVIEAVERVIEKELVGNKQALMAVGFEPSDDRRKRIYDYFINNNFSQFKSEIDKSRLIDMGLKPQFNWYINKNYEA